MPNDVQRKQLRTFGLLVGGIFALLGLWPAVWRGEDLRLWALILSGLLLIPALLRPTSLKPVHQIWMAIGQVLGQINTAILLSVVFYGVLTPMGVVMRLRGRDPMRRGFEPNADTYRVVRQPRPAAHMARQF